MVHLHGLYFGPCNLLPVRGEVLREFLLENYVFWNMKPRRLAVLKISEEFHVPILRVGNSTWTNLKMEPTIHGVTVQFFHSVRRKSLYLSLSSTYAIIFHTHTRTPHTHTHTQNTTDFDLVFFAVYLVKEHNIIKIILEAPTQKLTRLFH